MENETIIVDPSSLTTQMVWREIGHLKEFTNQQIISIIDAQKLAHDDFVRVPTDIQKEIGALKEFLLSKIETEHLLKEEKFSKVYQMFELIERQRLEQKKRYC